MFPAGFEPTIAAGQWLNTYALDCAATGTGYGIMVNTLIKTASGLWDVFCVAWQVGKNVALHESNSDSLNS